MFTEFKNKYCYGWIHDEVGGRTVYQHGGSISGFRAQVMRFPKEKVYIVVLSNFEFVNPFIIANKLGEYYAVLPERN